MQASPSKKFQPSRHVIGFCTAVFVEVLGTVVTIDDDLVKRILPFVVSGLQPGKGASDHKVRIRGNCFYVLKLIILRHHLVNFSQYLNFWSVGKRISLEW